MAAPRQTKPVPPTEELINIGDLGIYTGGFGIPSGDYALQFDVCMYDFRRADGSTGGPPKLGCVVTAQPLTGAIDSPATQFYGFGNGSEKSFAPNSTGKGIVTIPGGPGFIFNPSTNWAIFLKSLYDSGLPKGIFTGDCSVLDGMWVHTAQIDEPEERKAFANKMSEAQVEKRDRKISVVTEIKDNGKPWEGTGGMPSGAAVAAKAAAPRVNGQTAPMPQQPKPADGPDSADIQIAAQNGASKVLGTNANINGMLYLPFRTGTFTAVKELHGDDMAQAVQNTYFKDDTAVNNLLGLLGYKKAGVEIKPA